jgi:carboxymethylenebutenolidase
MNQMITIPSAKPFQAYLTTPESSEKLPGLILIHEVWGLVDHIKEVADRFAKEGYVVLAPDLLSETGITEKLNPEIWEMSKNPETRPQAQLRMREFMGPIQSPEFAEETMEKLKACVDYLLAHPQVNSKVAVLGFCFGGTYSFALAAADPRVKAAVPFYGHAPEELEKLQQISCPVLAFYGVKDTNLVDHLPELAKKMKSAHKDFHYKIYPKTGHAFFNNTNPMTYNKEAAEDSWEKSIEFLRTNL